MTVFTPAESLFAWSHDPPIFPTVPTSFRRRTVQSSAPRLSLTTLRWAMHLQWSGRWSGGIVRRSSHSVFPPCARNVVAATISSRSMTVAGNSLQIVGAAASRCSASLRPTRTHSGTVILAPIGRAASPVARHAGTGLCGPALNTRTLRRLPLSSRQQGSGAEGSGEPNQAGYRGQSGDARRPVLSGLRQCGLKTNRGSFRSPSFRSH
jgi:hypothetical protein